jgi:hypothetical protein
VGTEASLSDSPNLLPSFESSKSQQHDPPEKTSRGLFPILRRPSSWLSQLIGFMLAEQTATYGSCVPTSVLVLSPPNGNGGTGGGGFRPVEQPTSQFVRRKGSSGQIGSR